MKIVTPGHRYEVKNVDGAGAQTIQFVVRRGSEGQMLPAGSRAPGILGQELIRVLIDRTTYLNDEVPCAENAAILEKLRECLRLYEARASRRTIEKMPMPELADVCPRCHHILCDHREIDRLTHGEVS